MEKDNLENSAWCGYMRGNQSFEQGFWFDMNLLSKEERKVLLDGGEVEDPREEGTYIFIL